jgi:hypothetical protein
MVAILPALALMIALGVSAMAAALVRAQPWLQKRARAILAAITLVVAIGGIVDYLVVMPDQYHPQPDQIMSWAGLISNGESFYYVYTDPTEKNFIPYVMAQFRKSVVFADIPIDQLRSEAETFPSGKPIVVFYSPQIADEVKAALQTEWGSLLVTRTFTSTNGTPVLMAGMNLDFQFEMDRPFLSSLQDSYLHEPLLELLSILLVLFLILFFLPKYGRLRLPAWVSSGLNWFSGPVQPEPARVEVLAEEQIMAAAYDVSAADPPSWSSPESSNAPLGPSLGGGFRVSLDAERTELGTELRFALHFPRTSLPRINLPEGFKISLPPLSFPESVLLVLGLALAIIAQIYLGRVAYLPAAALYLLAAMSVVSWGRRNIRWSNVPALQMRLSRAAEGALAALLLAGTALVRYYDLAYRVYGLEADETAWTVQSWYSAILRVDRGEFATLHYIYLPVDFWLRSFFLRIFGLNFISARIESATLGLIAVYFLYLLVRRLTHSPGVALLSGLLYSFSFVALSASHQALAETTPEAWIMCGLFLFIVSIQERRWWQFQLTGVVLAAGMLTYETFFPTVAIVGVCFLAISLYRLVKRQETILVLVRNLVLLGWPIVLVYDIFTRPYLISRQGYALGWFLNAQANGAGTPGLLSFFLKNASDLLKTIFSQTVYVDSLLNWNGPLVNPWLLPFVVLGLAYNLLNLRKQYYAFVPIWFLMNVLGTPILLGSVWPRILFSALPPLLVWGSMGIWTALAALRTWLDGRRVKLALPVLILGLGAILFNDLHIFHTQLVDPVDRQKRRELVTLTMQAAANEPMVLFPYYPGQDDSVELESQVLIFSVAGVRKNGLEAANDYQTVTYDQLLNSLWRDRHEGGISLVYDKTAATMLDARQAALNVVLHCYPGTRRATQGRFFDLYTISSAALDQPACEEPNAPVLTDPADGSQIPTGTALTFQWRIGQIQSSGFSLQIQKHLPGVSWIEAEDAFQGNGWYSSSDFVTGFSGSGFVLDSWQAGRASDTWIVPHSGIYNLWVRSYKRLVNDQDNFLTVGQTPYEFAKNTNPLNQWVWEDLGQVSLNAGPLPLTLSRTYGKDPEYSVFIDALVISSDLSFSPVQDSPWQTILDSGEIQSPVPAFTPTQLFTPGAYRWKIRVYEGNQVVDSSGSIGIDSAYADFSIKP